MLLKALQSVVKSRVGLAAVLAFAALSVLISVATVGLLGNGDAQAEAGEDTSMTGHGLDVHPQEGGGVDERHGRREGTVRWPSRDASFTLQDAIDQVPDLGRLVIAAGVHEVLEPVFVRDKQITIRGAGSATRAGIQGERVVGRFEHLSTKLVGPLTDGVPEDLSAATGVINFINAGGELRAMDISGSDAAIAQRPDAAGTSADPNPPLQVRKVGISDTGIGILTFNASKLTVKKTVIQQVIDGIVIVQCKSFNVSATLLTDLENIAIFLQDCPGPGSCTGKAETIENTWIAGAKGGGIAAIRSGLCVRNSYLSHNAAFGIGIFNSAAVIKNSTIVDTSPIQSGDLEGSFGDGVIVYSLGGPALAGLVNNKIANSARAGVSSFGAEVAVANNLFFDSAFGIAGEDIDGFQYGFIDGGGNICDRDGFGPGKAEGCRVETVDFKSPEPISPIE